MCKKHSWLICYRICVYICTCALSLYLAFIKYNKAFFKKYIDIIFLHSTGVISLEFSEYKEQQ